MDKKFVTRFTAYWAVNAVVLSLASSFYPMAFAMGNAYLSVPVAALVASFLLTVMLFLARGLAKTQNLAKKGRYVMFMYYWGSASVGIWVVARIAHVSGFGIARFTWAIAVGLGVAFTNWLLRQALKGIKLA